MKRKITIDCVYCCFAGLKRGGHIDRFRVVVQACCVVVFMCVCVETSTGSI